MTINPASVTAMNRYFGLYIHRHAQGSGPVCQGLAQRLTAPEVSVPLVDGTCLDGSRVRIKALDLNQAGIAPSGPIDFFVVAADAALTPQEERKLTGRLTGPNFVPWEMQP